MPWRFATALAFTGVTVAVFLYDKSPLSVPATRMDGSAPASSPPAQSFKNCGISPCICASMLPIIWQAGT